MKYQNITSLFLCMTLFGAVSTFGCGGESSNSSGAGGSGNAGAGGSGGSGGGVSEYAAYCQADYDRDVKCMNQPGPTQVADCVANEPCDMAFFRDGVLPGIHTCVTTRDCMTGDDMCYAQAAGAVADTASTMAYGMGCTTKLAECDAAMTPFQNDICFNYELVKDSVLDEMTPCFSGPCDMVVTCVLAVTDKVYMTCPGK